MRMLPKVKSLGQLRKLAAEDGRYKLLMLRAAENLGGLPNGDVEKAYRWLCTNANETDEDGNGEKGVIAEVNFLRNLGD